MPPHIGLPGRLSNNISFLSAVGIVVCSGDIDFNMWFGMSNCNGEKEEEEEEEEKEEEEEEKFFCLHVHVYLWSVLILPPS